MSHVLNIRVYRYIYLDRIIKRTYISPQERLAQRLPTMWKDFGISDTHALIILPFIGTTPINLNNVLFSLRFQAIRHQVRRLPPRDKPAGSCEEGEGQGFPPELLHLPGVSEADEHRRGALRPGRQQVRLQAGLPVGQAAARHASRARSSR